MNSVSFRTTAQQAAHAYRDIQEELKSLAGDVNQEKSISYDNKALGAASEAFGKVDPRVGVDATVIPKPKTYPELREELQKLTEAQIKKHPAIEMARTMGLAAIEKIGSAIADLSDALAPQKTQVEEQAALKERTRLIRMGVVHSDFKERKTGLEAIALREDSLKKLVAGLTEKKAELEGYMATISTELGTSVLKLDAAFKQLELAKDLGVLDRLYHMSPSIRANYYYDQAKAELTKAEAKTEVAQQVLSAAPEIVEPVAASASSVAVQTVEEVVVVAAAAPQEEAVSSPKAEKVVVLEKASLPLEVAEQLKSPKTEVEKPSAASALWSKLVGSSPIDASKARKASTIVGEAV